MSQFDPAVQVVLLHEGHFVDNKNDPGGATNYGISIRYLKDAHIFLDLDGDGDMDADDMRMMKPEPAIEIYRTNWWEKYHYGSIADQALATKVLDASVNMGAVQAHKLLQRGLWSCGIKLNDDGTLGLVTLAAINKTPAVAVLAGMRSECAGFYRVLVAKKPDQFTEFLNGWLRRAYS
jgi:lysozyme family protein